MLAPSRLEDPVQKLMFVEGHWVSAAGGRAAVEHVDGTVYLAISLRNVGSGIGVCQGWVVRPFGSSRTMPTHAPLEEFRLQTRDLYVPAGDIGMWQGALRNPDDPVRAAAEAIDTRQPITVELLYTDQVGRQRTITRFGLIPAADSWLASVTRHWYLDWDGPRPETDVLAASEPCNASERLPKAAQQKARPPPRTPTAQRPKTTTPRQLWGITRPAGCPPEDAMRLDASLCATGEGQEVVDRRGVTQPPSPLRACLNADSRRPAIPPILMMSAMLPARSS